MLCLNDWLNKWSANNWTATASQDWNWNTEIALITGASGGIGASIVQQLLARNPKTKIVVVDYSPLTWEPLAGTSVSYYQCDLSDSCAVRALCSRIRSEVGHPTVLVNNAGLCRGFTVMEGTYNDVELTVRTNLIAPILLAKEVLPNMVKTNHGHIMHVSSMSSLIPPARVADYAATKAGISALHEVITISPSSDGPFIDHGNPGSSTGIDTRPQRPQCPPVSRHL
jgi:NAD(P)-dependent dehydrogenase (short-subunit alcohol dehydrogenase family)